MTAVLRSGERPSPGAPSTVTPALVPGLRPLTRAAAKGAALRALPEHRPVTRPTANGTALRAVTDEDRPATSAMAKRRPKFVF